MDAIPMLDRPDPTAGRLLCTTTLRGSLSQNHTHLHRQGWTSFGLTGLPACLVQSCFVTCLSFLTYSLALC